jgi:hypothetical protein
MEERELTATEALNLIVARERCEPDIILDRLKLLKLALFPAVLEGSVPDREIDRVFGNVYCLLNSIKGDPNKICILDKATVNALKDMRTVA